MTGKDVWRWILTKFGNDLIYSIYDEKKVVCKGFRTNTIQDIGSNRNRLISNLLDKNNFKKLVLWSAENPPTTLEGMTLVDKEVNELVDLASEKGVSDVLIKLLCENQERKAIQLFAFLQDEQSDLLDIPNQSIGNSTTATTQSTAKNEDDVKEPNKQSQEVVKKTSEEKKIKKLEKKVENLNEELKKRDAIHKSKVEELERNHQQTIQKLNEKNQLYGNLVKEKNALDKQYKEEKSRWEKEVSIYNETIESLEQEVSRLHERLDIVSNGEFLRVNERQERKVNILVIGKPALMTHFQSETIEFSFVEGNDVHDFLFPENFDAYLVLSYDLLPREQLLLKHNESYSKLDINKVFICKDFNEVRKQINYFNRVEERVI
jgi:hypothetical protein